MKNGMRRSLLGAALLVAAGGAYLVLLQLTGNFHEVVPHQLYRSAQISPTDLAADQSRYGIRSVINLRGDDAGRDWYDAERAESDKLHIRHYDFRMSADHVLDAKRANQMIALMRTAPKPLLIHCKSGADRTGLAAALYVAAISKGGEWAAERQLWPIYGHLPLHFNGAFAMNDSFEAMEPALGFPNS